MVERKEWIICQSKSCSNIAWKEDKLKIGYNPISKEDINIILCPSCLYTIKNKLRVINDITNNRYLDEWGFKDGFRRKQGFLTEVNKK